MRRFLLALVAGLAVNLLFNSTALADPLSPSNVQWTYDFTAGAPALLADANPGAGISFTNEITKSAVGNSDVVATNLRVFSAATAANPDSISVNGNYTLTLSLNLAGPDALPVPVMRTFKGNLSGTFSSENASIANTFDSTLATQYADIGAYRFTISLIAYTPPGPPSQTNAGSIAAHIEISGRPTVQDTPEPGSLMLSGLGLTLMGGVAYRRRRAQRSKAG